MKNQLRNQKGLALITTLVMMVLALGVVAVLLVLTTRATKLTGLQQDYTSALGAAKAGTALFINTVDNCSLTHVCTPEFGTMSSTQSCLDSKLFNTTSGWSNCGSNATDYTSSDATKDPDITETLGQYTVYIKIIDTLKGPANPYGSPCASGCYYYTVVSTAKGPEDMAITQFTYRHDE